MPNPDYLPNPVTLEGIRRRLDFILEQVSIEEGRVVDTESHLWDLLRTLETAISNARHTTDVLIRWRAQQS